MSKSISFSIVTRADGQPLTKIITPDGKGGISKQPAANFTQGIIQRVSIPFAEFGPFIRTLKTNQAIVHGVPVNHGGEDYQEFAVGLVGKEDPPHQLSRSLKYLAYPRDTDCLCMFDHDPKPGQRPLTPDELIEAVCRVVPDFAACPTWSTPSTSACIYDMEDNELSREGAGFHLYFPFQDADTLPLFVETLFQRLWLLGLGHIYVTQAGSMLERTIFDAAVFSPERLDFVAGAVCKDCEQRLPSPVYRTGKEILL